MEVFAQDIHTLREWTPLTPLLSQIPHKAQRGLFTGDLNLTCIAALSDHLAIGTNHGLVYWYNRATHELQRLRCENTLCGITCVGAVSSVDYMIAAGADNGTVTIFLVPKKLPDNVPDIFKASSKKQVERYTVGDLHSSPISALEWSTNGMKLFSGDQKGLLVVTEIDFYMHLSKSVEALNEKYEIVQLSYNSSQQLLLVSTLYRTILCHKNSPDNVWKVTQVGNRERKTLGRMGAIFSYTLENPRFPTAYCSRPGLRLWISNKEGLVEKTLIFKDAVSSQQNHIQLLNPSRSGSRLSRGEPVLGLLQIFMGRYLVTYSSEYLLILDPETISVVAALYDVEKISALCVFKSEIFILEGERHLIRLGLGPEIIPESSPQQDGAKGIPIASHILELTSKLKDASIISAIPIKKLSPIFSPSRSSGSSDGEHVSECMEAQELPPVLPLHFLDPKTTEQVPELTVVESVSVSDQESSTRAQSNNKGVMLNSGTLNPQLLDKINQEKYEEVVFCPKKRHRKTKGKKVVPASGSGSDTTSVWSSTSETDDIWTSERLDVSSELSAGGVSETSSRRPSFEASQSKIIAANDSGSASTGSLVLEESTSTPTKQHVLSTKDHLRPSNLALPVSLNLDLLAYDSIDQAIAAKEILLTKKYNVESVLGLSFDIKRNDEKKAVPHTTSEEVETTLHHDKDEIKSLRDNVETYSSQEMNSLDSLKTITGEENAYCILEDKNLCLNTVSDWSQTYTDSESLTLHSSSEFGTVHAGSSESQDSNLIKTNIMMASEWLRFEAPKPIAQFSVCSNYIVITDSNSAVHYSNLGGLGLRWHRADVKANQISLSPNAEHVWRIYENRAYALQNPSTSGPHGEDWILAGDGLQCVAVGNDVAWVVSQDGEVLCYKDLCRETPISSALLLNKPCEWPASKVACFSQTVWLLTTTGEVYVRVGVSSAKPEGVSWRRVNIPVPGSVVDVALGAQRTGWIIDKNNTIMFSVDHMEPEPHWWQVLITDYIFQTSSPLHVLRSKMTLKNLCSSLPTCQTQSSVASGLDCVWIVEQSSCIMHTNKTTLTGHFWNRVKLKGPNSNIRWQTVTSEGVFENGGQVWLLSVDGNLFSLSPGCDKTFNKDSLQEVPLPSERGAVCLAAASQALWLLTSSGEIYIRQGLTDSCLQGDDWRELSLVQIDGVHLTHISCGCDTVWACDTAGNMYMAISSPHAMATSTFSPAWIHVTDAHKDHKKIFFIKVFVGSQTSMVWALDRKGKIYVREAIFPDFQLGLDWVPVSGITALDLSISNSAVWALSTDGSVYQRYGITQTNYIGDYWRKIPGYVEALSASICDSLWGIDKSGFLLRHASLAVLLSSNDKRYFPRTSNASTSEDGDWEVIG